MSLNEAETRTQLIDPKLRTSGWGAVDGSRVREEYVIAPGRITGVGQKPKALIADYLLVYRNTDLAVVEAKADTCFSETQSPPHGFQKIQEIHIGDDKLKGSKLHKLYRVKLMI